MDESHELPPGYRLRSPASHEASDINRLSATGDAALGAPPSLTEDLLRSFWTRPRFVLETDAWVVERGRSLVGYAQVWHMDAMHLSAFAIVHPEHMGRGIGSALAAIIERRAEEMADGSARLLTAALPHDGAAARLLAARGYEWARRYWHMETETSTQAGTPPPPAGIHLRQLDPDKDLRAAHRILEEAFQEDWDYSPTSFEEFIDLNVTQDDFDPALWIIAVEAGEPVGLLHGSAHTDRGWIDELGVLRSHRGRGIATALLRRSIAQFGRRGLARVRLNVDSDNVTGAVALYTRAGMHVVSSYDLWARAVEGRRR